MLRSRPHPFRLPLDWHERAPTRASSSCVSKPCPPESGPSASDLRAPDNRTVSSERDVRVFRKGNFPPSRSFLICLDCSSLDPFTNVLPRITHSPPFLVTRVVRLVLEVLLRSPTPASASLPTSLLAYRVAYPALARDQCRSPGVTHESSVSCRQQTPWCDG
jgi:hypothetical protein